MRLTRWTHPGSGPAWPVRAVHLGPGAFFRSLPAWCTDAAGDGWGTVAVGRRAEAVAELQDQDGLFTVVVRHPDHTEDRVVSAVSTTATVDRLPALLADPEVAVVTLTITEAGYGAGSPMLAALATAVEGRLAATGAPIALVACDNLAGNGALLASRMLEAAPALEGVLASGELACPATVVDRITPAPTAADLDEVAGRLGLEDRAAVVTEPGLEWELENRFPGGRPAWERAGARFVADVRPYAARKLRILNAAHSLLAYAGGAAGYRWVHEAIADDGLLAATRGLWAEAVAHLDGSAADLVDDTYVDGLLARWANPRLPHALGQIAADGSTKLAERVVPTLLAAPATSPASAAVVGAWIAHLRGATPFPASDARSADLGPIIGAPNLSGAAREALALLDPTGELPSSRDLTVTVGEWAARYLSR